MSFHYWRNVGRERQAALHHALQQLPRRDPGRARGRQRRALQGDLPAAAHGRHHRALARLLRRASRARAGRSMLAAQLRAHGGGTRAARARGLRRDRRAAGAVRRRHAHVRPGVPHAAARGLRPPRRAPDRGRDRGRLRAHRHAVRLRAGRHPPGLHVPVEGPDRRLPAAVGGADHRGRVRRVLRRVREAQCLPALAQLHRQPARLRRRQREPRPAHRAGHAGAQPRARRAPGRAQRRPRRPPPRGRGAPARHDRRGRDGARPGQRARPTRGRSGAGSRCTATRSSRGVLLRPIGNVVYFMPPYVVTPEEIDLMVEVAREGIGLATCA